MRLRPAIGLKGAALRGWSAALCAGLCLLGLWAIPTAARAAGSPAAAAAAAAAAPAAARTVPANALSQALVELAQASYDRRAGIIRQLAQLHAPRTKEVLQALLDGNVYARQRDNQVFIVAEQGEDSFVLNDPATGKPAGTESQDDFDKVVINNQLRRVLQVALAQIDLAGPVVAKRLAAVQAMLDSLEYGTSSSEAAATLDVLRGQLTREHDAGVSRAIQTALALASLANGSPAVRLAAIKTLHSSLDREVYSRLQGLTDPTSESDPAVRRAAAQALRSIDFWRTFYGGVETLFFGLSLGSVLALAAIGLAITFGVMGVINMAHGELMMLGAYTAYVLQLLLPNAIGASVILAVPAAFLVCGAAGAVIERSVVRFLYGRPLETLLATFGMSLILQQLVRDVFSANNRPVASPSWMSGSLQINPALELTYNRLVVVLFTLAVFAGLLLVMWRTRLGLQMRAVAQNRSMAKAMGVRTERIDALSFALGSAVAGVAGVALSQLTNVGPSLGQDYIVDSFMVVVFGGVGSLWGTLIGGMSIGVVDKILEPYAGAVLGKIVVLVCLILFIQRRPRGLFPQRGRAAEA